jgi:hypothetical protein
MTTDVLKSRLSLALCKEQSMPRSVGTDCQGVYDGIYLALRLFCCAQSVDLSGCEKTLRDDVFTLKYPFFSQLRSVCSIGKIEVDLYILPIIQIMSLEVLAIVA